MHLISYVSNSIIEETDLHSEVLSIVEAAQRNNAACGVTGVLFCENGHFFQAIEGNEQELRGIFQTIERDQRHRDINLLIDQPVANRAFEGWSLDTFYIDAPELINPTTLKLLQALYVENFDADAGGLIEFIKKMIDEMDTYKILQTPYMP